MAIDFKDAKAVLKTAIEDMDHSYLNDIKDFKVVNPTSENIARLIYRRVKKVLPGVKSISVWENESSCATYTEA